MGIKCKICETYYEVQANQKLLNCQLCGCLLTEENYFTMKTKEIEETDNLDDFSDIEDLDDLDDLDIFEDANNLEDFDENDNSDDIDISSYNNNFNITQFLEEEKLRIRSHEEDFINDSYSNTIKNIKIFPQNLINTLYDYQVVNEKYLLARIIYMLKIARTDGIIVLRKELETEPNSILRLALAYAIDGTEPDTVHTILTTKQEWFKKIYLQYSLSPAKEIHINKIMLEFNFIIESIMLLQGGYTVIDLYEKCKKYYPTFNLTYKDIADFEDSQEKYFKSYNQYLLLNEEDYKHIQIKDKKEITKLLDIFNKKRDLLQPLELYVLEDIQALAKRFLMYTQLSREEGILAGCLNASLQDSNILVRHLFQILIIDEDSNIYKYTEKYKQHNLAEAKKYHNDDFILLYEREIDLIYALSNGVRAGDSPSTQLSLILSFIPEFELDSIIKN